VIFILSQIFGLGTDTSRYSFNQATSATCLTNGAQRSSNLYAHFLTASLLLEPVIEKVEAVAEAFRHAGVCKSREQYYSLEALKNRLQEAAAKVARRIECLDTECAEQIHKEGKKYLSQVETTRASTIKNNQVKSFAAFKKSIALIFEGPKDSILDQSSIKSRNKQTRIRCEAIRELNPDGVISLAAGVAPHVWSTANMKAHAFEYLIDEIEPEEAQVWPPKIREILHVFREEEAFAKSQEYLQFLTG